MTDPKGARWLSMTAKDFAAIVGDVHSGDGDLPRLATLAQVRAGLASEQAALASQASAEATQVAAEAQRSTAKWTKALAIVTAVLAAVTALLVALTMWSTRRSLAVQEDTLRELRRQNCIASVEVAAGVAGSSGAQQAVATTTRDALAACNR